MQLHGFFGPGGIGFDVGQGDGGPSREVHREVATTMSNQPTERSRRGRVPRRAGSGVGRAVWLALAVAGVLLAAPLAAFSAQVVEVRVGRHPDFTRVVFELDRAAGYRIERNDPGSKNAELIVSLEAGSIPRRIQSSKSFIEQVVIEPSGTRSVARIRLAKGGLKLKEMILASPPRIVLDVISEQAGGTPIAAKPPTSSTPVSSTTKPTAEPSRPTPTKVAAPTTPASRPGPAATPTSETAAQLAASAKPVTPALPAPNVPAPKTKVLASTDGSKSASSKPSDAASEKPSAPAASPEKAQAPVEPAPSAASPSELARTDDSAPPSEWRDGSEPPSGGAAADPDPGETPAEAAARSAERPMVVKSSGGDAGDGDEGGLVNWGLAAIGVALAGFLGLVIARRRRAGAMDDAGQDEAGDSPFTDVEEEEEKETNEGGSNPFAGLATGAASPSSFATASNPEPARPGRSADLASARQAEKKQSESLLFDDAEEKKMESMEVISRSQVNELGGSMPMMGGGSDELTQMFREMQRRVAALESRIDELVDARDRLERQVAAQTEELRVQRAAIARTQRAVRNLAREDGGDDEPTEPALREPT